MGRNRLLLVTAGTPVVWGTTYAVTTELLPPGRPLLTGALRALPAGLLLLGLTRRLPRGSWWWRAAVLGTLNIGAFFALLFVSAYRLPGGVAAVLGAAQPLVVAGLTVALLAQRVPRRTVLAGLAGVLGVALTVLTASARLDPVGVAAGLAGTASMALGVVLTKRWTAPVPLLTATAWQLTAGGLLLLPLAVAVEGAPDSVSARNVVGWSWLALVGGALAYAVWFRGIARLPAASVSLLALLSPVVATVLGWALLGQALTALQVLGMAVALGALVVGATARPVGAPDDRAPLPVPAPAVRPGAAPASGGAARGGRAPCSVPGRPARTRRRSPAPRARGSSPAWAGSARGRPRDGAG
jgi:probable blue pigment (indigoidine) exporter